MGLKGAMNIERTIKDLRVVSLVTIGNGLWLGLLAWLVLGVWLEVATFLPCWIGATLISWFAAIQRQHLMIEQRAAFEEQYNRSH